MAAHAVVDAGRRPVEAGRDRISLTGITAFGHHGVFDSERQQGQRFVVDVSCTLDLSSAASTDDLAQTDRLWSSGAGGRRGRRTGPAEPDRSPCRQNCPDVPTL